MRMLSNQKQRRPGLARFAAAEAGNVALVFALSMPLVIGGAGLGAETGYWYYQQLKLQEAADAAAYAAGVQERAGSSSSAVSAAATAAAVSDGFVSGSDTIAVHSPPTSGPNQNANSVEVLLTRPAPRFFSQFFGAGPVTIRARAVSTFSTASQACVLALSSSASQAVYVAGSANTTFTGCDVMSNSVATDAVYVGGSGSLTAPCVLSTGGVSFSSTVTLTGCSAPLSQLPPVADPYGDVSEPADTGTCLTASGSTLSPGRYCGGLSLTGTVTLQPGVYIISGGTFQINASANVSGSGVTFVLASNAAVSFNGTAHLNLSAPTSGTYSGLLFFGSRSNSSTSAVTLNGTADSSMTGAIYFPEQTVAYKGNFSGVSGCTQVVANQVQWTGNTTINDDCSAYGMKAVTVSSIVKLAE